MLYSALDELQGSIRFLYSSMGLLGSVWNDRVSRALDATCLNALRSECDSFCAEVYSQIQVIEQNEERLQAIAGKY